MYGRVVYVCVVDSTDERVDVLNVRKVAERRECARTLVTPGRDTTYIVVSRVRMDTREFK